MAIVERISQATSRSIEKERIENAPKTMFYSNHNAKTYSYHEIIKTIIKLFNIDPNFSLQVREVSFNNKIYGILVTKFFVQSEADL